MMICCVALLSSCAVPGDFCEVVTGEKRFDPATGAAMIRTDREDVVQIRVENDYWLARCQVSDKSDFTVRSLTHFAFTKEKPSFAPHAGKVGSEPKLLIGENAFSRIISVAQQGCPLALSRATRGTHRQECDRPVARPAAARM